MTDLDKIRKAFELLAHVAFPVGYLGEAERSVVQAHLDATKCERARELLATRGRSEAAGVMGCSEAQVYKLAHIRLPPRIPQSSAEIET